MPLIRHGFGADGDAAPASRSLTFDPVTVTGEAPPSLIRTAAPWVIGAGVLIALWYFANDAAKKRGRARRSGRPLAG